MQLVKKMFSLLEAFGPGFPDSKFIEGYEPNHLAPKKDPLWVWQRDMLRDLVIWWTGGDADGKSEPFPMPTYIGGFTGTGKSSAIRNFCACLNIPYYEKTMSPNFDFLELESERDLVDGNTITNYGSLPQAMGVHGFPGVLVLNELDRVEMGALTPMYEVFEGQPYIMRTGGRDVIEPKPGFSIVGTGNTALMGDTNGLYGANQQDLALVERFINKLDAVYPDEEVEESILAKVAPNLDKALRKVMIAIANDIRNMHMGVSDLGSALPITMSTRTLIAWAKQTWAYREAEANGINPTYYALDRCLLNTTNGNPEWRNAIMTVVKGRLGDEDND